MVVEHVLILPRTSDMHPMFGSQPATHGGDGFSRNGPYEPSEKIANHCRNLRSIRDAIYYLFSSKNSPAERSFALTRFSLCSPDASHHAILARACVCVRLVVDTFRKLLQRPARLIFTTSHILLSLAIESSQC
jgi:hypothetical protein